MDEDQRQILHDQVGGNEADATPLAGTQDQLRAAPGALASNCGLVLILLAIVLFFFAFNMNVLGGAILAGDNSPYGSTVDIVNFDRLAQRQMIVTSAAALLISGVISLAASGIMNAITSEVEGRRRTPNL